METATYIDTLLKKYQQAPSFPFQDWVTNSVSFYAAMNLWDEVFKTAAGKDAADYIAVGDAKMDIDSDIFCVKHKDQPKKIGVYLEKEGGTFHILTSQGQNGRDRFELGLPMDIERNRLICAFEMIRAFTKADLKTADQGQALNDAFVERYKDYFGFSDWDPFAPVTHDDDD